MDSGSSAATWEMVSVTGIRWKMASLGTGERENTLAMENMSKLPRPPGGHVDSTAW